MAECASGERVVLVLCGRASVARAGSAGPWAGGGSRLPGLDESVAEDRGGGIAHSVDSTQERVRGEAARGRGGAADLSLARR